MVDFLEVGSRFGSLPAERTGRAAPADLIARRAAPSPLGDQPGISDIEVLDVTLGGVNCTLCRPSRGRGRLVHFHGGAFRSGSAKAWTPFGTRLAAASGRQVYLPDYALAPELPFPAALEDAFSVVQELGDPTITLALSGDSAGGGLAAATALTAQATGIAIDGVVLMSPWLDLTVSAESYRSCAATDAMFSHASAAQAAEAYLQGVDPKHPLASPTFADLATFPDSLVFTSACEVLRDDALRFTMRMAAAHRRVELHVLPDQPHVWPVLAPKGEASEFALGAIARFFRVP